MKQGYLNGVVVGLLLSIGSMAAAETVELVSKDGSFRMSGELIEFDNGSYVLDSTVGRVVVDSAQVDCLGDACPVLTQEVGTFTPGGQVELISLDGNTTLNGTLVAFDGSSYTLSTILGNLIVDALQVECVGDGCPVMAGETSVVNLSGDPSILDNLLPDLLDEFGQSVGGESLVSIEGDQESLSVLDAAGDTVLEFSVTAKQATQSLNDLLEGRAGLAILSRPVTPQERSAFLAAGLGDMTTPEQQIIFGLDGIVIVTSESNPVRALSKQALAGIFSGEIGNWSQVGGPDAPINLFASAEDTGTGALFNANIMIPENKTLSPDATLAGSDQELVASVAADPLAIGFAGLSNAANVKILNIRDACGIQVPATPFTIKTEEYPLTERLFIYTTNAPHSPELTRFLEFLASDAAQAAVARSGRVDLRVSFQSNNEQGLRHLAAIVQTDRDSSLRELRNMTSSLLSADRLSITLRFALGSAQLDDRARDDIQRLARFITTNDLENKELLLVGFTDSIGNANANITLSQQRANSAYRSLINALPDGGAAGIPITPEGFGELSPLICNDTPNGRQINRRVEVWLRDIVAVSN